MKFNRILVLFLACGMSVPLVTFRARGQSPQQAPTQSPARFILTPLTTHGRVGGSDLASAVSPDGKRIAYIRFEQPGAEVRSEIWLLDRVTGQEQVLIPKAHMEYWGIDFAPDGKSVYVVQSLPPFNEAKLVRIRLSDRQLKTVRSNMGRECAISPNGRMVAFNRRVAEPPGRELVVAPLDGGPERVLARRTRPEVLNYPVWRPDGVAILFHALDSGHGTSLIELSLADGKERVLAKPDGWGNVTQFAWLPGGRSFIVGVNQGTELWRVSYPDGAVQRLGFTRPDLYSGTDSASAAPVIVARRTRSSQTIWLAGRETDDPGVEQAWPHITQPIWNTNGTLLFLRSLARGAELVTTELDGREIRKLPLAIPSPRFPKLSLNGKVLVVSSYKVGDRRLWRSGPNGEEPMPLTPGPSDFFGHDVSPDGTWVAYTTYATGRFAVWRIALSGETPTQLLPEESYFPVISPDGQWVAALRHAATNDPYSLQIVVVPASGGKPLVLSDLPLDGDSAVKWTPDGRGLSFRCARDGIQNICSVPRDGGPVRQITKFKEGLIGVHDWSPSGQLLVMRTRTVFDLVMITLTDKQ